MTAPRKTLQQMQAEANGQEPMQIAGKPADVCPYCGCGMYAYKSERGDKDKFRYVQCRNAKCVDAAGNRRRFYSRHQSSGTIVRELGTDDECSSFGNGRLTLIR